MQQNEEEHPVIIAQTGPLDGQRWVLQTTLTVGREFDCQINIPDRQVSRYHARFSVTPDGIQLEDLGSKNGTHYNGVLVEEPVILQDGDVIQIALIQNLIYYSSDATVTLSKARPPAKTGANKLRLDSRQRRVWIGNEEVMPSLSAPQFTLLEAIFQQDGEVVPRNEIIQRIWGSEDAYGISEQALDALVRRLRDRLAAVDPTHNYIITVRGHGIRLDNPPE
jgi:pSer/pThr/pTyr-binding forkhead associated (FHA) protein